MSTPSTSPLFSPATTVGELVAARPLLARIFERLGIDYCCGGRQSLGDACARRGLDVATTVALLESAGDALAAGPDDVDPAAMGLAELADHIESTHHALVKSELPRLAEMAGRVARKHGGRDPRLTEVAAVVDELAAEMFSHMRKEEEILFPLVRQLEGGAPHGLRGPVLAGPIGQMESEHEEAGRLLARLRTLTDAFAPDAESCNTHRALLAGLEEFESDLHRHVHKENNILFPRALALAGAIR